MSRRLFTKIVREVTDASHFFQERYDCTGHRSISALMKYTLAVRQLAYGCVPDSLDEYLLMGATTARDSLRIFCKVIMNLYGEEFLRKLTYTDMEKLYAYHDENHGFPGIALDVPFVANNVPYKRGYYLTDGIYPQWSVLIKSFKNPGTNDHKRILYKTKHEAARKDVERAFGVLKQKWKIIKYPARGLTQSKLSDIMYTCIILHNMIIHDSGNAISPNFFLKEQHRDDDPVRTHAESMQVTQEIIDRTGHLSLKADLVEHIWNNAN
ncbi:ALP1-like protein [Tanacetum coccineum]